MDDLRERYPEIERPHRLDGSPEARKQCLRIVVENFDEIVKLIEEVMRMRSLEYMKAFLFQSRAMGTCKLHSDIDIYIQLSERHRELVEDHGVLWEDAGVKVISGAWASKFLSDLPQEIFDRLNALRIDLFFGVESKPPAKREYRDLPYYLSLRELEEATQR